MSTSEELSEVEGYLVQNVLRHLKECGRLGAAVALLSHMGWTKLRITHGGINALNADFSLMANAMRSHTAREEDRKAWAVIMKDAEALPTHAYVYLLGGKIIFYFNV